MVLSIEVNHNSWPSLEYRQREKYVPVLFCWIILFERLKRHPLVGNTITWTNFEKNIFYLSIVNRNRTALWFFQSILHCAVLSRKYVIRELICPPLFIERMTILLILFYFKQRFNVSNDLIYIIGRIKICGNPCIILDRRRKFENLTRGVVVPPSR